MAHDRKTGAARNGDAEKDALEECPVLLPIRPGLRADGVQHRVEVVLRIGAVRLRIIVVAEEGEESEPVPPAA